MDPRTETAEAALRRHQPQRFWSFFGISRCRSCRKRWPCNFWHCARDRRDRVLDVAAIARMTEVIRQIHGDAPSKERRP